MREEGSGIRDQGRGARAGRVVGIEVGRAFLEGSGVLVPSGAFGSRCESLILRHGAADQVLGCRVVGNPLAEARDGATTTEGWEFDPELPGSRLISWSGTFAQEFEGVDPRNWMAPGKGALEAFCARVRPALERHGWTVCFQPHARHVLSDARSCRDFLAGRVGQPFELALSPASMLEVSMIDAVEEHLERWFSTLGPMVSLVVLEDVRVGEFGVERVGLGEGVLPMDVIRELVEEWVPVGVPVVLRAEGFGRQVEVLGVG